MYNNIIVSTKIFGIGGSVSVSVYTPLVSALVGVNMTLCNKVSVS